MTASNFNQFLYLSDLSGFGNFELKGSSMSLILLVVFVQIEFRVRDKKALKN